MPELEKLTLAVDVISRLVDLLKIAVDVMYLSILMSLYA